MKKIGLVFIIAVCMLTSHAQTISKITIGNGGAFEKISFALDEYVIVNVSRDGNILDFGTDHYLGQMENYQDRLDPFGGRVEYYGPNDNESFRGKIKSIGRTYFTYYASYDYEAVRGKLKSIGNLNLDYYLAYENEAYRGSIKNVGQSPVTWYGSSDNEGLRGKLRSFGNTQLNYYAAFEDKAYRGKVKSIDRFTYTYYSSLDRIEYRGAMKTGTMIVFANAVKYYVK